MSSFHDAPTTTAPSASDIYYKLGGLEGKLDAHHNALNDQLISTAKRLDGHGSRLDLIEKAFARLSGVFLVGTPVVAVAVAVAAKYLGNLLP